MFETSVLQRGEPRCYGLIRDRKQLLFTTQHGALLKTLHTVNNYRFQCIMGTFSDAHIVYSKSLYLIIIMFCI